MASPRRSTTALVTIVDRLIHRAEVIDINAESYRVKEAKEPNAART